MPSSPTTPCDAPSFGLQPAAAVRPAAAPLLLALSSRDAPAEWLQRACLLADGMGGELHVVRVLPSTRAKPLAISRDSFPEILRSVEQTLTAHRATRAWMRAALPDGRSVARFAILHGDFVERVAVYARESNARLIVVATDGEDGGLVTRLVAATGMPVLASRAPALNQTIVAATDLRRSDYPVLQFAAALGCQLEASVIAVHNLCPGAAGEPQASTSSAASTAVTGAHAARLAHLRRAAQHFATSTRAVVSHDSDPVEAILGQARAEEAGLVVVGSRARAWFEGSGLAATLVDRARRSVLVIPMEEVAEPTSESGWG